MYVCTYAYMHDLLAFWPLEQKIPGEHQTCRPVTPGHVLVMSRQDVRANKSLTKVLFVAIPSIWVPVACSDGTLPVFCRDFVASIMRILYTQFLHPEDTNYVLIPRIYSTLCEPPHQHLIGCTKHNDLEKSSWDPAVLLQRPNLQNQAS